MSAPRDLYRIWHNNNKGNFHQASVLAENEGEAIKKFREHYGLDPKVEVSVKVEAEHVQGFIA